MTTTNELRWCAAWRWSPRLRTGEMANYALPLGGTWDHVLERLAWVCQVTGMGSWIAGWRSDPRRPSGVALKDWHPIRPDVLVTMGPSGAVLAESRRCDTCGEPMAEPMPEGRRRIVEAMLLRAIEHARGDWTLGECRAVLVALSQLRRSSRA